MDDEEEWDESLRRSAAHEEQARAQLEAGHHAAALETLDRLLAGDKDAAGAHIAMQYAFIVGLHRDAQRYHRALELLRHWDALALAQAGRPFAKPFAGHAGLALILHAQGENEAAVEPARAALRQVLGNGPIEGRPELGKVPQLPPELFNRLTVIAGLWDVAKLGPRPRID